MELLEPRFSAPMALSDYYDVSRYAGASLVLYSFANIGVRTGCIRGDGRVRHGLVYVSAVMFQRAFWATVRGGRVDWLSEACYWVCTFILSNLVSALDSCVDSVIRRWERMQAPPPQPVLRRGRGGRRPLV